MGNDRDLPLPARGEREITTARLQRRSQLNWNTWIRQVHRWLSIVFTATVIANFVTLAFGQPPSWVVYSPLPPLFLLMFSGLYMFVLPYAAKRRGGRGIA
jgi:hypothetical protein